MVGGQLCGLWGWVLVGVAVHHCWELDLFTIVCLYCGIRGAAECCNISHVCTLWLELIPSNKRNWVDCGGSAVHIVVVRGVGGGVSIVKLLTPSTALCKYAYIFVHYHSHMHALQVQQLYRNKHIEAPNLIITIGVEFTV
jgi:hypothetical protein